MPDLLEKIAEAKSFLESKTGLKPEIGIILGTGLGKLADHIEKDVEISYSEIPHFAQSTVETHVGRLIFGRLSGRPVMAMQGRFHFYEGYDLRQITFPVRMMKAMGARSMLVSNVSGCMNPQFKPGDIMVITDHINLLGTNPLVGVNHEELGPRFPDMSAPYDRNFIDAATRIALESGISLQKGVYACMSGPSLETAAEYRMLRIIGADVIGMSTVPEVIVAVHAGLKVLGLSVITDACLPDNLKPANISEIIAIAGKAETRLVSLIEKTLKIM